MADKIIDPFINVQSKPLAPWGQQSLTPSAQSQNFFGTMYVGNNKLKFDGQNGRIVSYADDGLASIVLGRSS